MERIATRSIIPALKARRSKAQGASPGLGQEYKKPCKGETDRCAALTGLNWKLIPDPGFRAFTLGFAASRLRRSGEIDGTAIHLIVTGR
jgi:hypothetical protein